MTAKPTYEAAEGKTAANDIKNYLMVALTLIFITLYGAALVGWLSPLTDERMVTRLEPIIFVLIGYYFGRLPSQQNEEMLKQEISRQTQKADAAQHAKEQAQQSREELEEKVKNVRAALAYSVSKAPAESFDKTGGLFKEDAFRHSVAVAVNILNS